MFCVQIPFGILKCFLKGECKFMLQTVLVSWNSNFSFCLYFFSICLKILYESSFYRMGANFALILCAYVIACVFDNICIRLFCWTIDANLCWRRSCYLGILVQDKLLMLLTASCKKKWKIIIWFIGLFLPSWKFFFLFITSIDQFTPLFPDHVTKPSPGGEYCGL